jgi:hypothetical protein
MMYVIPVLSVITIYNTTLGTGKYGVCLSPAIIYVFEKFVSLPYW